MCLHSDEYVNSRQPCCCKYSLKHQICVNPPLQIVPYKCINYTCSSYFGFKWFQKITYTFIKTIGQVIKYWETLTTIFRNKNVKRLKCVNFIITGDWIRQFLYDTHQNWWIKNTLHTYNNTFKTFKLYLSCAHREDAGLCSITPVPVPIPVQLSASIPHRFPSALHPEKLFIRVVWRSIHPTLPLVLRTPSYRHRLGN